MPTTAQPAPSGFRHDIEGIRGIAVLVVVLYHAELPGFAGGYIGVDIFFALSGYLITGILARQLTKTGTLDLLDFYGRRFRRLSPAFFAMLVGVVAALVFVASPLENGVLIWRNVVASALYLSNVQYMRAATDYLADTGLDPLLHTWSLAVEEQFYLLWPLLLFFVGRGVAHSAPETGRRRMFTAALVASVVSFGLALWYTKAWQPWAFFGTPMRAWEFGLGALAALRPRRPAAEAGARPAPWLEGVGVAALAALLGCVLLYSDRTRFPGLAAVPPVVATVALLLVGETSARTLAGRVLALRPLQAMGQISYSWYLWHWPFLVLPHLAFGGHFPLWVRLWLAAASAGVAWASLKWIENPVRYSPWLSASSRRSLAMAGVLGVLGAALGLGLWGVYGRLSDRPPQVRYQQALADHAEISTGECVAGFTDASFRTCAFGALSSDTTVVLLGDSKAGQWLSAVDAAGKHAGWRVLYSVKTSCPLFEVDMVQPALHRLFHECDAWRAAALDTLRRLRPNVILASTWNGYTRPITGNVSAEAWEGGAERTLAAMRETGAQVLFLQDTPDVGIDVPRCLSRLAWNPWMRRVLDCSPDAQVMERWSDTQALTERAAQAVGVPMVNPLAPYCTQARCALEDETHVFFRDHHHLTGRFARSLAPAIEARVAEALGDTAARGLRRPVPAAPVDESPERRPVDALGMPAAPRPGQSR